MPAAEISFKHLRVPRIIRHDVRNVEQNLPPLHHRTAQNEGGKTLVPDNLQQSPRHGANTTSFVALDWTAPTFRFRDGISHIALQSFLFGCADRSISR